jgi:hypothetical protein
MEHFFQNMWDGAVYDVVKWALVHFGYSVVIAAGLTFIFKRFFRVVEDNKDIVMFSGTVFAILTLLFFVFSSEDKSPKLIGNLQQVLIGNDPTSSRNSIAVFSMNILNRGGMSSIVYNWKLTATINGHNYEAVILSPAPRELTFNIPDEMPNMPSQIKYHGDEDIIEKAQKPIQSGGMVVGTIFVMFKDISADVFKVGADYMVKYEDVLGNKYASQLKGGAQFVGISAIPGVHADMSCPVPKNQAAK